MMTHGIRIFQAYASSVVIVPPLIRVVLLISATNPAAPSLKFRGTGVGVVPPLPDEVPLVPRRSRINSPSSAASPTSLVCVRMS